MKHTLKLTKLYAKEVFEKVRTFDIRQIKEGDLYQIGDFIHYVDINREEFEKNEVLDEFDNSNLFKITFVQKRTEFIDIPKGYCIFSIERVDI